MDDGRTDGRVGSGSGSRTGTGADGATTRERLIEAARALMAGATLDDLTAFITVRRLAEQAGLSSGAVYSAFVPGGGDGSTTRTAAQVAAREAFDGWDVEVDETGSAVDGLLAGFIEDRRSGDASEVLRDIVEMVSVPIVNAARGDGDDGWTFTHNFLGAATALNDPAAGRCVRRHLHGFDNTLRAALEALLHVSGRRLVDGVDMDRFVQMINIAADGCGLRLRIDPDLDPAILPAMYLAIVDSMTRPADVRDDLPGHRLVVEGQSALDEDELAAVRSAVLRVHSRAGWPAVTLAKVGQISGVSDVRLAGQYGSRHALAEIAWTEVVAGVERRSEAHAARPVAERLLALFSDLADVACSQRSLVASLLIDRLERSSRDASQPVDAPTDRLVSMLAAWIGELGAAASAGSPLHRPVVGADGYRRMACTLLDAVLLRASTSSVDGEELAERILAWVSFGGAGTAVPD